MRLHRFNVEQPLGEDVVINEVSLINQWTKVFRYKLGDFVVLFNGDGSDYCYSIDSLSKNSCTLTQKSVSPSYVPVKKSYLYIAIVKKDHFELIVQKAVELGVTDIVPFISERTAAKNLDTRRLLTIIREATEQSGRGDILTIHEPVAFNALLSSLSQQKIEPSRTFATTLHGKPFVEILRGKTSDVLPTAFIVGPEGGWTDNEEAFFIKESFVCISLGGTTLRAETAGIVSSFLSPLL